MLLRCESLEPPMSQLGQERRIGRVCNISALHPSSRHGADLLEPPLRVKLGKPSAEHIFSGIPPLADLRSDLPEVSEVPQA